MRLIKKYFVSASFINDSKMIYILAAKPPPPPPLLLLPPPPHSQLTAS